MQQSPVNAGPSPPEDNSPPEDSPQTQSIPNRLPGQKRSPSDQNAGQQQLSERPRASRLRTQRGVLPSPSDYGSLSIRDSGVAYVSSAHYGAILDSIAELKNQFAQEDDEEESAPDPVQPQTKFPLPHLLYSNCPMPGTRESILAAIPPRPVVDRLVSCWFNSLDLAPGKFSDTPRSHSLPNSIVLYGYSFSLLQGSSALTNKPSGTIHSGKFLREVRTYHKLNPRCWRFSVKTPSIIY